MNEVAKDIMDPRTGKPVFDEARKHAVMGEPEADAQGGRGAIQRCGSTPLGSGSDFTPFLQHLTSSALSVGFGGESPGGVYHSAYDTVKWYQTYSDGDYSYGRTLSQLTGTLLLRLADAPVLPFQFVDTADTLMRYVVELEKLAADKKDSKVDLKPVRKPSNRCGRPDRITRRPTARWARCRARRWREAGAAGAEQLLLDVGADGSATATACRDATGSSIRSTRRVSTPAMA